MRRASRIALISAGAAVLIVAIVFVAALLIGRSEWLRETARERIIAEAEGATGGRVEIGAFKLDWSSLTAELDNLVIHGKEPAGTEPLLAIKRVTIGFRIISLMKRDFDVARLEAQSPRARVIFEADGSTNIPEPRTRLSIPDAILDLKVGKFDLADGMVVAERGGNKALYPWSAKGENLGARVTYSPALMRYDGDISVTPLDIAWEGFGKVTARLTAKAAMERNRVTVSSALFQSGASEIDFSNVAVNSFITPVTTAQYDAHVSLADADRIFKLVNFQHTGTVNATGGIRYVSPQDYELSGAVKGAGVGYGEIRNMAISGTLTATPGNVRVTGLHIGALGGEIVASGEVRKLEDVHLAGSLQHFDAGTLLRLGGLSFPYDGFVSGPFDATGKLNEANYHRLVADATVTVSPAERGQPLHGELSVKYDALARTIELGHSWLELPKTRVEASGVLGHRLEVKLQTQNPDELQPALGRLKLPFALANGSVSAGGSVTGPLANPRVAGHAEIRNAVYQGQKIDSLAGDFTAMESGVTLTNAALAWGDLRGRVTGSLGLNNWNAAKSSAVQANVQIVNGDLTKLLALAGEKNAPVSGGLTSAAQVTGTLGDPHATADFKLTKGQVFHEPYDTFNGHAQYLSSGAQTLNAALDAGRKRVTVTARFDHARTDFLAGKLTFNVSSNAMALNQIARAREREPGIQGSILAKADGVIEISPSGFNIVDLNADLRGTALALGIRQIGDARFTAQTKNDVMTAHLDSDAAKAAIHGEGTIRLAGDYPVDGKLTFANVGLGAMVAAMMPATYREKVNNLDGSIAGEIMVRGPAKSPELITASLDVPQFELHPLTVTGDAGKIPNLSLKNSEPIRATISHSVLRVESARFEAPSTTLDLSGTVRLKDVAPLDLRVQGKVNLALARSFSADLTSSGELTIRAAVRGTLQNPDLTGTAELQKGDFRYAGLANGLTNTSSLIAFNGNRANIQRFTAETGGGLVDATGFAAITGGLIAFRVEAKTKEVRLRYPEGVSTVSDSDLTLAGTSERSQASGTVTIHRVSINPKSDVSAILESAAQPARTPQSGAGFLSNMNLDVQIETAPDVAFETSVAQSIQADANLRLRGTSLNPAVLGRINITEGELVFFGNKYTINQGSVSFFNPAKIDPILNVDLETKARGVDVTLTVSGPVNKLNLSYRSDPPLQWADIVALLATGRSPTDPTLAVRDTGQSQNLQQLGASALIGQAISNPVGGNLQRFFGVSRIKIDPQLIGITGSPEARLTIEQQVNPQLLLTYISDVSSTSTQLIQVEWDFNRRWAAILTREENGYVGVDFAFKKRFK